MCSRSKLDAVGKNNKMYEIIFKIYKNILECFKRTMGKKMIQLPKLLYNQFYHNS